MKSVFGFRVRLGNPDLDFENLNPDFPIERTLDCMFCFSNTGHVIIVGFTLEAKLVSSKHLIQVHLEIFSRSVQNMASHLLTKYNP